jgi:hypothetical protein
MGQRPRPPADGRLSCRSSTSMRPHRRPLRMQAAPCARMSVPTPTPSPYTPRFHQELKAPGGAQRWLMSQTCLVPHPVTGEPCIVLAQLDISDAKQMCIAHAAAEARTLERMQALQRKLVRAVTEAEALRHVVDRLQAQVLALRRQMQVRRGAARGCGRGRARRGRTGRSCPLDTRQPRSPPSPFPSHRNPRRAPASSPRCPWTSPSCGRRRTRSGARAPPAAARPAGCAQMQQPSPLA